MCAHGKTEYGQKTDSEQVEWSNGEKYSVKRVKSFWIEPRQSGCTKFLLISRNQYGSMRKLSCGNLSVKAQQRSVTWNKWWIRTNSFVCFFYHLCFKSVISFCCVLFAEKRPWWNPELVLINTYSWSFSFTEPSLICGRRSHFQKLSFCAVLACCLNQGTDQWEYLFPPGWVFYIHNTCESWGVFRLPRAELTKKNFMETKACFYTGFR